MITIDMLEGIATIYQREYIEAENKSYDDLVKSGFKPQGRTKDFKKVVVFRIENEHMNNEVKEVFHFNNWQEARNKLCKNCQQ